MASTAAAKSGPSGGRPPAAAIIGPLSETPAIPTTSAAIERPRPKTAATA
jgi:hypothetical protein